MKKKARIAGVGTKSIKHNTKLLIVNTTNDADASSLVSIQEQQPDKSANEKEEVRNLFIAYRSIEENPPQKITVEQLRKHNGYEDISEEDANEIIETLYRLAILSYKCFLLRASKQQPDSGIAA